MFFQQKHEEANLKLTQKEQELTAKVNKSNMIQTNFEEIDNLQKEKSKLDSDIKDFQVLSQVPSFIAIYFSTFDIDINVKYWSSQWSSICEFNSSHTFVPPHQSTAYPINGDIIHNIFAVGGLGTMLLRVPVAAGLSHSENSGNYSKPWNQPKPSPYVKAASLLMEIGPSSLTEPLQFLQRHKDQNSHLDNESNQEADGNPSNPEDSGSSNRLGPKQTLAEACTNAMPTNDLHFNADNEDNSDQEVRQPLDDNDAEPSDMS
ncbi:hypothetical protein EV368DRAFT_70386 [Lentinula lateritia]|nr:hypothetical protein EV368DRAFT_70386 [Lentinula lateritia]